MKILKIVFITLILMMSINAQQKQLVNKTSSVEAVGFKSFTATWYCLTGKTASGIKTKHGIVAADPRIFKLGTTIDILGMGSYLVADTGGAIKGNKIDIWTPSCNNAKKLGRKKVFVKKK